MSASGAAEILAECRDGRLAPTVALMRLILAADEPEAIDRALGHAPAELAALWRDARAFWPLAKAVQASVDGADIAAGFDRAAALSPDAASALYGLGDPALLQAATAEVVEHLEQTGAPLDGARVLDIGCGSGRFEAALAGRAREILGLEVSAQMAAAARRRCEGWPQVRIALSEGGAPPTLAQGGFDLALAVDSFPYIVPQSGKAEQWFAAVAGALAEGGHFAIFNFSYRGDPERDLSEVARLAHSHGFAPIALGAAPFRLWDGLAFHLRRERGSGRSG